MPIGTQTEPWVSVKADSRFCCLPLLIKRLFSLLLPRRLGIDGATVSILTPFPKTPIYEQFKNEGRLLCDDWSKYNSKTAVAFQPKNMTTEELFDDYLRFRQRFFSLRSFVRRMRVSRTNIAVNFIMNLGYRLGIHRTKG